MNRRNFLGKFSFIAAGLSSIPLLSKSNDKKVKEEFSKGQIWVFNKEKFVVTDTNPPWTQEEFSRMCLSNQHIEGRIVV